MKLLTLLVVVLLMISTIPLVAAQNRTGGRGCGNPLWWGGCKTMMLGFSFDLFYISTGIIVMIIIIVVYIFFKFFAKKI